MRKNKRCFRTLKVSFRWWTEEPVQWRLEKLWGWLCGEKAQYINTPKRGYKGFDLFHNFKTFFKLTYVAVDGICKGHDKTVGYGRVGWVFQPEIVDPMLPKVECKSEINSNKPWNIKRATRVSLTHFWNCVRIDTDTIHWWVLNLAA